MYLEMQRIDDEATSKVRLNAPSQLTEARAFINGYLSGINDARAQILHARTKEFKHEALDFMDCRLKELENGALNK